MIGCGSTPLPPASLPTPTRAAGDELPGHVIVSRVGSKFQVRAVATLGEHSQADFESMAVSIADAYSRSTIHVMFFDSEDRLIWSSAIEDADRSHWLCDVDVDRNSSGELYASSFRLAPRTDVLTGPNDDPTSEPESP